jgi:GrpB-like predicted nucleotidyltransferase (UPF0157 family)
VDAKREAYLDEVLIGGRQRAEISVVEYDERWPLRFREIAERLRQALAEDVVGVEHIGSTSVPGLAAKPIVDVLLTVADVSNETAYLPALESVGFQLRVREPAHRMVRTPARDVHVHLYEPGRQEVRDHIDLRDWLRVDAEDRELYAATKRMLARQQGNDVNDYADAKTEVIADILARARAWRAGAVAPRATG